MHNLEYFEHIAYERDKWKSKNRYYWDNVENLCTGLIPENDSVIEIGCGTGELIGKVKSKRKVGIDFSKNMIDIARIKYPDVDFHVMQAEYITLNETFDYIILSNTIGYLYDIQKVFNEIKKVCHPFTKIIIVYYNFFWQPILNIAEKLGLRMKQPPQNWLSKKDIENLLYLSGFEAFKFGERMLIPINVPVISHFLNKYLAKIPLIRNFCITNYIIARLIPNMSKNSWENQYSVSVVIPARNESGNIESAILRIPKMGKHTEIIFIEGNSIDGTWETIKKMHEKYKDKYDIKITQQDGIGKGDAVRKGFEIATGDILMILDADLTVPPEELVKFYDAIASGKGEFINGSRLVYNMDEEAMRFLNLIANKFFSLMFTWLLDQRFKDTLCGTKVLFKKDYERIKKIRLFFGDFDPFGDFDLIFGASKLNLKIIELPIRYKKRLYGKTNISRFKHGILLLKMCLVAAKKIKFSN